MLSPPPLGSIGPIRNAPFFPLRFFFFQKRAHCELGSRTIQADLDPESFWQTHRPQFRYCCSCKRRSDPIRDAHGQGRNSRSLLQCGIIRVGGTATTSDRDPTTLVNWHPLQPRVPPQPTPPCRGFPASTSHEWNPIGTDQRKRFPLLSNRHQRPDESSKDT
ncbi:hypothetical protein VTN77DRAFT_5095 [Rasamsonia byssochlamydoides]|uniref:uncharacterized protein n=1 Tax=Rasamsonia byssochlamydoides TaxID=89139 RepID=UPI00374336FA